MGCGCAAIPSAHSFTIAPRWIRAIVIAPRFSIACRACRPSYESLRRLQGAAPCIDVYRDEEIGSSRPASRPLVEIAARRGRTGSGSSAIGIPAPSSFSGSISPNNESGIHLECLGPELPLTCHRASLTGLRPRPQAWDARGSRERGRTTPLPGPTFRNLRTSVVCARLFRFEPGASGWRPQAFSPSLRLGLSMQFSG